MNLQYISDDKGEKNAVIIPMKQWKIIEKKLGKQSIIDDLKEAFEEVKLIREGKIKPQSLKQLLNEL
ncbi:MAG: hypothetical protein IIA88_10310 [Bacteroidetes bacterium]|nr:hypothetical protein [Bacteroidota bacterium]